MSEPLDDQDPAAVVRYHHRQILKWIQPISAWVRPKLWTTAAFCSAAALGAVGVNEFAVAVVLFWLSGALLIFYAWGWPGITSQPTITRVAKLLMVTVGITMLPLSVVWVVKAKGPEPWSLFLKDEPQTPSQLAADKQQTPVRFKALTAITPEQQSSIIELVDSFCAYLEDVGFDTPSEFPPLGVIPSNITDLVIITGSTNFPGGWVEDINISAEALDSPQLIIKLYADVIFKALIPYNGSTWNLQWSNIWVDTFSNYYVASFLDLAQPPDVGFPFNKSKWLTALWGVRQTYGRQETDSFVFYIAVSCKAGEQELLRLERHGMSKEESVTDAPILVIQRKFSQLLTTCTNLGLRKTENVYRGPILEILKSHGVITQP